MNDIVVSDYEKKNDAVGIFVNVRYLYSNVYYCSHCFHIVLPW